MEYLKAFVVGGGICVIGQLLINYTKITPGKILVFFLVGGMALQAVGLYDYLVRFGGAGATVPISGFGYLLIKGAVAGSKEGLMGAICGGLRAASPGLAAAILFGFLNAVVFRAKTKKQ